MFSIVFMMNSLLLPISILATSGISASIFCSIILIVNSSLLILCICQFGFIMYIICFILFGSISSVVVARSLFDLLVKKFTFFSFSEKYHR
jgi:hypothetical protein